MTSFRARSALFMPASNPRAIAKARTLACDVVILDLEDAVAPEAKEEARGRACAAAGEGGFGDRRLVLRVNALDTPWGRDDLAAAQTAGFDAILLPKVASPDDLRAARGAAGDRPLWAMIETCAAMLALPAIVAVAAGCRLDCLVVGTNDLATEMRAVPGPERTPLLGHLASIVTAARAARITALDGVYNRLDDEPGLAAECAQGAMFGFDGKSLIHPGQIATANQAFAPSPARIAWAERVVAAYAGPGHAERGAIRVDGAMVERLHLAEAEAILTIRSG